MKFLLSLTLSFVCFAQTVPVLALTAGNSVRVNSVDDPPTPAASPDPEMDEAKRRTALAEERKKKAEAEAAEAEAKREKLKAQTDAFGDQGKVSIPTGGVQTDQEGFVEVKMLSLEAARQITQRLAQVLCNRVDTEVRTLVIYDEAELNAISVYRSMHTQLEQFHKEFAAREKAFATLMVASNPQTNSAESTGAGPTGGTEATGGSPLGILAAPGIATGMVTSIAQLINLFRTDTSFQNKNVAIPEDMVVSYLVSNLQSRDIGCQSKPAIYYPQLYPARLFQDNSGSPFLTALKAVAFDKTTAEDNVKRIEARTKVIGQIAGLIEGRDEMKETLALKQKTRELLLQSDRSCRTAACRKVTAEAAELKPQIDAADETIKAATGGGEAGFLAKHKGWQKDLKRLQTVTQFMIDSAENVITQLETPDETTKMPPLTQVLSAEQLAGILKDKSAFMLRVAVTANGTTKIKKNMFVDAKVRHSAGANLVFQLFDHEGRVVEGDAMQFYFDYKSAAAVRDEVANAQQDKRKPDAAPMATASAVPKKQ